MRRSLVIHFKLGLAIVLVMMGGCGRGTESRRVTCEQRLWVNGTTYWLLGGTSNLVALAEAGGPRWRFLCPATTTWAGEKHAVDHWADYLIVDWFKNGFTNIVVGEIPDDFPILYDRRLANHGGYINVYRADGSILKDQGALWLYGFATRHPNFRIPLPEDFQKTASQHEIFTK
jgi:hypothetical protein